MNKKDGASTSLHRGGVGKVPSQNGVVEGKSNAKAVRGKKSLPQRKKKRKKTPGGEPTWLEERC